MRTEPTPDKGERTRNIIQGTEILSPGGAHIERIEPSTTDLKADVLTGLSQSQLERVREECYITSPTDDAYLRRTRNVPEGEPLDDVRKKQKQNSSTRKSLSLRTPLQQPTYNIEANNIARP